MKTITGEKLKSKNFEQVWEWKDKVSNDIRDISFEKEKNKLQESKEKFQYILKE